MNNKGSVLISTLAVIAILLSVIAISMSISSKSYVNRQTDLLRADLDNKANKPACEYVKIAGDSFSVGTTNYMGKTPRGICTDLGKEPEFIIVQKAVNVWGSSGNIYSDWNSLINVDDFDVTLGRAEEKTEDYGRPDDDSKGDVTEWASGVLCC